MSSQRQSTRAGRVGVLLATSLVMAMASMDTLIVTVAVPDIRHDFAISPLAAAWVIGAYLLTLVVVLIIGGRLADQMGRRRIMLIGIAGFGAASALGAVAPDDTWLVLARGAQGVAAGLMLPPGRAMVVDAFPREEWGRALSVGTSVAGASAIAGPLVGGVLIDTLGWRAVLWVNLPLAALALWITIAYTRESRDPDAPRTFDLPGAALLAGGLAAVVVALLEGQSGALPPALLVVVVVGGLAALAAFVAHEHATDHPLLELAVLRRPAFLDACAIKALKSFVLLAVLFLMVQFSQDVLRLSALETGLAVIPLAGTAIVTGPVSGWLCDRFGIRRPLLAGLVLLCVGIGLLTRLDASTSYWYLVIGLLVVGCATELLTSASNLLALGAVGSHRAGQALGVLGFARRLGGLLGVVAAATLVDALSPARGTAPAQLLPDEFAQAVTDTLLLCLGLVGIVAVGTLFVLGRPPREPIRGGDHPLVGRR